MITPIATAQICDERRRLELLSVEQQLHLAQLEWRLNKREIADGVWQMYFNCAERAQFHGGFEAAFVAHQTLGMWQSAKGLPPLQALLQLARLLGYSTKPKLDAIAHRLGYFDANEEVALERLLVNYDLVMIEDPFQAYWRGEEIDIDWNRHPAGQEYFQKLCREAKAGQLLSYFDFGENASPEVLANRKYHLIHHAEFPEELAAKIETIRGKGQRLKIPPPSICIVQETVHSRLTVVI